MCTDSKFGFDENSEFIIFNFKKEYVRKIEVFFKTQIDRKQIAIGDLQIFYTESDAVHDMTAPACVEAQIVDEKFDEIGIKVRMATCGSRYMGNVELFSDIFYKHFCSYVVKLGIKPVLENNSDIDNNPSHII